MRLDAMADFLFTGVVIVPGAFASAGEIGVAILAFVPLLIASCLCSQCGQAQGDPQQKDGQEQDGQGRAARRKRRG